MYISSIGFKKSDGYNIGIIVICSIIIFFVTNKYLGGYLENTSKLGSEIAAPPETLYDWNLSEKAPFKYRILFPTIVKGTWKVFFDQNNNKAFFWTYYFWSLTFFISTPLIFYIFLRVINFTSQPSLLGVMLYFFSPAVVMAYSLPVHTREDMLAYSILLLGLICLIKQEEFIFLIISLIGVSCRETLLLLPFLYFFFYRKSSLIKRIIWTLIPFLFLIVLRIILVIEKYDSLEGLRWNLENPIQVIGFTFITFHFLWIAALIQYLNRFRLKYNFNLHLIMNSFPWVVFLIILTTFAGGIVNEIRLLFLMFPWMIVLSLYFIITNRIQIKHFLLTKNFILYEVTLLTLVIGFILYINSPVFPFEFSSKYDIPFDYWIILTLIYLFSFFSFTPIFINIISKK